MIKRLRSYKQRIQLSGFILKFNINIKNKFEVHYIVSILQSHLFALIYLTLLQKLITQNVWWKNHEEVMKLSSNLKWIKYLNHLWGYKSLVNLHSCSYQSLFNQCVVSFLINKIYQVNTDSMTWGGFFSCSKNKMFITITKGAIIFIIKHY